MSALSAAPTQNRIEQAPPTAWESLRLAARDIKLSHSIFAMPFALLGAFLAFRTDTAGAGSAGGSGPGWRFAAQVGLVVLCMVMARTWAMLANRLLDADVDALNPRTTRRAVASGALPRARAVALTALAALGFIVATGGFWVVAANPWPVMLSVPVLAWLAAYSLGKRFTAFCHVMLGSALSLSPIAAAIAVRPAALGDTPALWWIAGMVTFWVAGFDVIYALQDLDFDRGAGLHSIPSRLGVRGAILLSRVMHVAALTLLIIAARSDARLGVIFGVGVVIVGLLLVAEHVVLARRGKAGLEMAFFTLNGVVSCVVGSLGIVDLVW